MIWMSEWQHIGNRGFDSLPPVQAFLVTAWQAIGQRCRRLTVSRSNRHSLWGFAFLFALGLSLSVALTSCGSNSNSAPKPDVTLSLVSYSVTQAAYEQIIPKFVQKWQQEHSQNVTFKQSYGASASQACSVIDGSQPADVVHLSLALDTAKIVGAGLIKPGWEKKYPRGGIVTRSTVALVTRADNPKGISTWEDLARDDVRVITPDPKTSGGARWNFLALWGYVTQTGGDEARALEFVTRVYKNAPVLPASAREASDLFFKQNQGDVLLNYEDEVILAISKGEKLSYFIPQVNLSIDNPIAVVDKNADQRGTREVAEAFVDFLYTPEAQREFGKLGYRPVNPNVVAEVSDSYPPIQTLFTVQDLGGWDTIQDKFFKEGAIFDQIQRANKSQADSA
ncbi:sulfate ABC transporter substrate-binding protein [Kamptonema formosum]|uniref:sulfate ABC transporter substrate-binding protein n=1 Tax=Kamptonema formosum TaxID=331992 RepID=UPI00034A1E56